MMTKENIMTRSVVKLTERGVARVLDGKAGMTFVVDNVTADRDGKPTVAHVRDYRYENPLAREFQIWSLGKDDYETLNLDE